MSSLYKCAYSALVVCALFLSGCGGGDTDGNATPSRQFVHPSLLATQENLETLGDRVQSGPAAIGYAQLVMSDFADVNRPHTPHEIVYVINGVTNEYEDDFRGDAQAAHATALMWVITGEDRYRDKSLAILNDWSQAFTKLEPPVDKPMQAYLEAAWAIPVWLSAADIIRYYNDGAAGWSSSDQMAFDVFISHLLEVSSGALEFDHNWGTTAVLAKIMAAVYFDDSTAYDDALALYRQKLDTISNPDGTIIFDYLRDPWHPQYTILTWMQTAEVAWNQGDDLYAIALDGQVLPRLAVCLEHFSQLFLGELPNPRGLRRGDFIDSHLIRQGYDMGYNHFVVRQRLGTSIPTFTRMVPDWRPGEIDDHFLAWDTLLFGNELP